MQYLESRVATTESFVLAEGPFWDASRQNLMWVDIEAGEVLSGSLAVDGTIQVIERVEFPGRVGAVAPSTDGLWLVAVDNTLCIREPNGQVERWVSLFSQTNDRRLNDGKPDPAGRYLIGTMPIHGQSNLEELFLVADGRASVIDSDLSLSNGLSWSVDGNTLFSIDSALRTVFRRAWDSTNGTSGERQVFLTIEGGYPDGMTVDSEDHLWVAVWGAGEVRRFSPSGELVTIVHVPSPHVSSVAFAGPELSTLVITTAKHELSADNLAAYPDAGRLFTVEPGTTGAPQALWTP